MQHWHIANFAQHATKACKTFENYTHTHTRTHTCTRMEKCDWIHLYAKLSVNAWKEVAPNRSGNRLRHVEQLKPLWTGMSKLHKYEYCCAYRLLCIHTLNGTWWSMKLRNNNNTHKHSRKSDDQTQAKLARRLTQRLNLHIGKCAKLQVACKRRAKTKNKNKKKSATTREK